MRAVVLLFVTFGLGACGPHGAARPPTVLAAEPSPKSLPAPRSRVASSSNPISAMRDAAEIYAEALRVETDATAYVILPNSDATVITRLGFLTQAVNVRVSAMRSGRGTKDDVVAARLAVETLRSYLRDVGGASVP